MSANSSASVNETEVLYEISLSIGSSLDLKVMLKAVLSKILRGLNCNVAVVYSWSQQESKLVWQCEMALPRNAEQNQDITDLLQTLNPPSSVAELDSFNQQVERVISNSDNQHHYTFLLEGFGFLILKRSGNAFGFNLYNSLQKVMPKLAHACRACLHESDLRKQMLAAQAANIAKSQFLARMSHEIRTPMNGILGMLELLLDSPLSYEQKENVLLAEQSASHLLQIINDILDLSRIEAGKLSINPVATDLHHLVHSTVRTFLARAQELNLQLTYSIASDVPQYVRVDSARLRQVLTNILGNAIKFTHHGSVELRLKIQTDKHAQTLLSFSVVDTGIGIAPEKLSNMFNPFEQADSGNDRQYEGTGLGLAICREIMQSMHGNINATSELGKGSVFHFQVPLKVCSEQESNDVAASKQNVSQTLLDPNIQLNGTNLRVLVVDDKPINYKIASKFLRGFGCEVEPASNGLEALEKIKADQFDVVFMDVMMPEMDGFTATRHIRTLEQNGGIGKQIIVAMTANAMQGDKETCIAAGMDDYLAKPVNKQQMRAVLGNVLKNKPPCDGPSQSSKGASVKGSAETKDDALNIDWERALNYLDNDPDLLRSLIAVYIEEGPQYISSLQTAQHNGNSELVKVAAHTIKTMAASFFCESVRLLAYEVEHSAIQGRIEENLITRLVDGLEKLIIALKQAG